MGSPKSFKTRLMLKMGVELVRDGYKVYYGDCENGVKRIRNRAKQAMLEIDFDQFKSGDFDATLNEMTRRFRAMGGDKVIDHYPAYK
jgi:KaiC/GvpD/RAD55 family RecA-like ATPase